MHRLSRHFSRRSWVLAALVIALIAGHGAIVYYVSANLVLSAAILAVVIIALVLAHVVGLGRLSALFRRSRPGGSP